MDGAATGEPRIEDLVASITRRNTALQEAQARMGELRGTGKAAEDRVTVEVDQYGALTALRIDPRAMRLGAEALAEAVLAAAEQGVRDVRTRAEELMRPLVAELASANTIPAPDFGGTDLDDVLAALRDLRRDLRM
jgi:DNA-binding protein YbaB